MDKLAFHAHCRSILEARINALKSQIQEVQDSANSNTKSSAGDKYETGRAMAHLELEKLQNNHQNTSKLLQLLKSFDHASEKIEAGSLLETDKGWFYIAVALGKIDWQEHSIFCVSPSAPIAQSFLNHSHKTGITFNQVTYQILSIY